MRVNLASLGIETQACDTAAQNDNSLPLSLILGTFRNKYLVCLPVTNDCWQKHRKAVTWGLKNYMNIPSL